MLRTLPPTNCSQISEEIPLLLVIMSHRAWDGREDWIGEKGKGSQTSVIIIIVDVDLRHVVNLAWTQCHGPH